MKGYPNRILVVGVMVHWFGKDGNGNQIQLNGRFGIKELVPSEIFDKGTEELMKWSEKQNKL